MLRQCCVVETRGNIQALQTTRRNRTDDLRSVSSGALLLDSSKWQVRILVTRTLRRLGLFPSFPETAVKTTSFHKHDHLHRGHSSFLGFAYSKISQDLSSNRGARDVITQPYRWRKLGICAEKKHSRPVQGARGTFGAVFIPCIG